MKPKRSNPLSARFFRANSIASAVVMTLASLAIPPSAFAASQTYAGPNTSKVWDTTTANWDINALWINGSTATFQGTGESVTVAAVTANGITFSNTGFTLALGTPGTITLGAAATPIVANADATIAAIIAGGTNGFTKSGAGILTLSGVNTFSGGTSITTGAVKLGNAAGLGTGAITVASGASLDVGGSAATNATNISGTGNGTIPALYNSGTSGSVGTLKLNADASIGNVNNGDTSKTLSLSSLDLNGKKLTITGGATAAGIQNITSGDIEINSGGTLYSQNGGSLTSVTGTITIKTGGLLETRDCNNTGATSVHTIALNGGSMGRATMTNNNGGGAGTYLKNNITVDATNGGTITNNSGGFSIYYRLAGALSGSGALTLNGSMGVDFQGDCSGYTGTATATAGTVSFTDTSPSSLIFTGNIAGSRPLTQSGTGTYTLGGANTYTGATTVSAGTLILSGNNTGNTAMTVSAGATLTLSGTFSGTGATTVSSGGTLKLDYSSQNSSKLANGAVLTLSGGTVDLVGGPHTETVGSTTLNGVNTITSSIPGSVLQMNTITRNAGATINFAAGSIASTDNLNNSSGILGPWATVGGTDWAVNSTNGADGLITAYSGGYTLTSVALDTAASYANNHISVDSNQTPDAAITPNSLRFNNPGAYTLNLTGVNTINLGAILVTANVGNFASTITGGTLQGPSGGDLAIAQYNTANTLTIGSIIQNNTTASSLTKGGAGTLVLSGANTFTGVTTISAGTLSIAGAGQLNSGTYSTAITDGGVLRYSSSAAQTLSGVISGSGSVVKDTGTSTLTLTNTNTYSGGTTVTAGTIQVSGGVLGTTNAASTAPNTALILDNTAGVSLSMGTNLSVGSLAGGSSTNGGIALGSNTLTTGTLNTNTSYAGPISGTATAAAQALVKLGSGSQTLSGANTYTGTTTVTGTLNLDYTAQNNSKLADASALIFSGVSGLSMNYGSHTEIVGSTTLNAGAVVTISRPTGSGVLQMGAITRNAGAYISFASPSIATTSTLNTNGILGTWATIGNDWATNSTNVANGPITAYTGYTDVTRLSSGTKAIPDSASNNIRITEGTGTAANITLAAAATNVNSLLQSTEGGNGAATVALPSQTLRVGVAGAASGIMSASGAGALTIGSVVGEGTVLPGGAVANVPGVLTITNNSTDNPITINSVLAPSTAPTSRTGTVTTTANTVTGLSSTTDLVVGMAVNGTGVSSTIVSIDSATQITINNTPSTAGSPTLTFGSPANGLVKAGNGSVVIAGNGTWTGTTKVLAGSLEVLLKTNDVPYTIANGATLKLAYGTGGNYANTAIAINGDGAAATTGLWLKAGANYNASGQIQLLGAPTTIRQYGTGLASIGTFDVNGNGIWVSAAASGSSSDANIQYISRGYGMSMSVDPGANTATGDFTINGPLNVNSSGYGFYKRGTGSLVLNAAALSGNLGLQVQGGTVICGVANCIGSNAILPISAGAKVVLNGYSQTVANLTGAGTVTNGSTTLATLTVTDNAAVAYTFSGVLGGAGTNDNNLALAKAGTNTMILSGTANTYTGGTSVNGGTLRVTGTTGTPTGTGALTVNTAGTLDGTGTIPGPVTVSATGGSITPGVSSAGTLNLTSLTFAGTGTLNFKPGATQLNVTGSNGLTVSGAAGSVVINIGTTPLTAGIYHLVSHNGGIQGTGLSAFKLGIAPAAASAYTLVDSGGYLALVVPTSPLTWSGASGSEWSTNAGVANWIDSLAASSYVEGRDVVFDDSATTTTVNVSAGTVAPHSIQFNNTSPKNYTVSGMAITGPATVLKLGTGSATLTGVNSYTGAVTVNQGTLAVDAIADGDGIVLGGGTLSYTGTAASSNRTVTLNSASTLDVASGPFTLSNAIGGAGTLAKTGAGTLTLTGTNTSTGGSTVTAGTLAFANGALGTTGAITMNGGTLQWNGTNTQDISARLTMLVGKTAILDTDGNNVTLGTSFGGGLATGGLVKNGTGILTLTTNENFSGGVTVNAGTLKLNNGGWYINPFGMGNTVTINSGGTLQTNGAHSLGVDSNSVFVNGGILQLGAENYISSLHMAGGLVTGGELRTYGGTMTFDVSATGSVISSPTFNLVGNATLQVADGAAATDLLISGAITNSNGITKTGAGTLTLSGINTYTGNTAVNAGTLHLTSSGKLRFAIGATSGVTNAITGTGALTVDGAFVIDASAVPTGLNFGAWVLDTTTTLAVTYGSTFSVMNTDGSLWIDAGGGKWTKTVGIKIWTFDKATGTLTLTGNGFAGWAATHAGGGTAVQDYDADGVSNGLEWVLGGSETTNDLGKLPSGTTTGGNLIFTFQRDQQILTDPGTVVQIEVGTNLIGWTETYTVGADTAGSSGSTGATGTVTVTKDTAPKQDTVTLTVPQSPDTKKFARMKVLITP